MGLKATGTYLSRTLSYQGAAFKLESVELDPTFRCGRVGVRGGASSSVGQYPVGAGRVLFGRGECVPVHVSVPYVVPYVCVGGRGHPACNSPPAFSDLRNNIIILINCLSRGEHGFALAVPSP